MIARGSLTRVSGFPPFQVAKKGGGNGTPKNFRFLQVGARFLQVGDRFLQVGAGFSRLVVFIIIWPELFIHHDVLSKKVHYIFHDLSARPHRETQNNSPFADVVR